MLGKLTDREEELIVAARGGDWLACGDLEPEELRGSVRAEHLIRGQLVRELLLGRRGELDPRGVLIRGARITGEVDLENVTAVVGLNLFRCVLDEPVQCRNAHLPWMYFDGTQLPSLNAPGIQVDRNLFLRSGFATTGSNESGAVNLLGAYIGGNLEMNGTHLTNTAGPVLNADRLRVDGSVFLRKGFVADGNSEKGAVHLLGAHIGSNLEMSGARLSNTTGPALNADRLRIGGNILLRDGFTGVSAGEKGTVHLLSAHVGGNVEMDGAHLTNTVGPALNADGLQVDGSVYLRAGFVAASGAEKGTVYLLGARIDGNLDMDGAQLSNTAGPALNGSALRVGDGLFARYGFVATSDSRKGTMQLLGAQVGSHFQILQARLENTGGGPLLDLESTRGSNVLVDGDLICPRARRTGTGCPDAHRRLDVDGFTYNSIARISWEEWLHLVRCHTRSYRPMPYQQLAAVRTAAGHDRDARRILVTQQQDHRARGDIGGPVRRATHRVWGGLAGYGYRTGRTALALLTTLLMAGGLGWWAGHTSTGRGRYAAEHPAPPGSSATGPATPPGACSPVELIGLGIDRGLPLASSGIRNRCDLDTASPAGQWFTVAIWLLQAVVWALATLALAGYTGLIRKIR